jgi:hypothetical protein
MKYNTRRSRTMARDEEPDRGEIKELLDNPDADLGDVLALIVETAGEAQAAGLAQAVILRIKWRRILNNKWRSPRPQRRRHASKPRRFPLTARLTVFREPRYRNNGA